MDSDLERRFATIVRSSFTTTFKPLGFRKSQNTYVRHLGDISWVVDVQRDRWNTQDHLEFTINCGIYVPRVFTIFPNVPEPKAPNSASCCISARIGMLKEDYKDMWWELDATDQLSDKDARVTDEVVNLTVLYVVPLLKRFQTRDDVISYLRGPRPEGEEYVMPTNKSVALTYLAIIYYLSDRRDDCCETFEEAELLARNQPNETNIREIKQKFCGS